MPMVPLGLKETKEIDFREPFKVSIFSIKFLSDFYTLMAVLNLDPRYFSFDEK